MRRRRDGCEGGRAIRGRRTALEPNDGRIAAFRQAHHHGPTGEGLWEVTIGPIRSGFHYYELLIDGHAMNDPASQTYFGWARPTSGLEVPDDTLTFYVPKDVPHGEVRIRPYLSKVTGQHRQAYVYTPPGYDQNPAMRYPVSISSTDRVRTKRHGRGKGGRTSSWTR